ncbi:MAG TPA: PfkB family carbohydrate kinase [Chthoniobacterales bacterium]|nr:PfkB family carbohydrate kinase [Chthoniobacterales bacterium]
MPSLVVVGSYNTDLIIWCDRIPNRGETLMGGDSEMYCGGRGANCAVAAARAGCEVSFVGAHGPDAFGKMALDRLEKEGISISNFVELPFSKTGLCLVFHERRAGAHAALVANSANNQFPASLVRKAEPAIRKADLIFTVFEIGNEALLEVFRLCRHWRKRLIVLAAPVDASTVLPIGNYYLLVLDDFEALSLTRQDNLDAAVLELHRRGAQQVIARQKFDSLIFSDGVRRNRQPIPRQKSFQAAGAAECLAAWAGITLAMTGDLARAAQAGAEAMAFSLSMAGAQDSLPYRSELPSY